MYSLKNLLVSKIMYNTKQYNELCLYLRWKSVSENLFYIVAKAEDQLFFIWFIS